MVGLVTLDKISLKNHPEINEKIVQEFICEDPSILGLGDLEVIQKERVQPSGGRLDILLGDEDTSTRYELELQLGETDPDHIIRTIEYWDVERKRYPQYDHCAVIVAEDLTGRFANVISLFNGHIPLIALKLDAYKTESGDVILTFNKIVDRIILGTDHEDVSEEIGRDYWLKRSDSKIINLAEKVFKETVGDSPQFSARYTKNYIGVSNNGIAANFVYFKPRKNFVTMLIQASRNEEIESDLEKLGLEFDYKSNIATYRIRLNKYDDFERGKDKLMILVNNAKEHFRI